MESKKQFKPMACVLDVDDVICDFVGFLCILYNKMHNTHITRDEIVGYPMRGGEVEDIHGDIVAGQNIEKTFRELEPHGLYTVLPVFHESKLALKYMKELGFKIFLLTARDKKYYQQTVLNLLLNDIQYDELIFNWDKAYEINRLKEQHDIIMFVDDRASTVKAVNNNCNVKYPVVINKPHNKKYQLSQRITRCNDLLETISILKQEFREKKVDVKEESKKEEVQKQEPKKE